MNSIRARLLLSGLLFTIVAVVLAALTIRPTLDQFVRRNVDASLESQISVLARAVKSDGSLDQDRIQSVGPFVRRGAGWAWVVKGPAGVLRSQTVAAVEPRQGAGPPPWPRPERDRDRDRMPQREMRPDKPPTAPLKESRRWRSRSGWNESFYFRTLTISTSRGPVTVTAGAPRYIRDRMRDEGLRPLLLSLGVLGVGLLAAMIGQLELGLRPLRKLGASLAAVRAGEQRRIDGRQPRELEPVVAELNALLDHNEQALAKARSHVSNLAHGLKTPLATLAVRLAEPGRDPDGSLASLIAQIDGAIGHHLGRARAASPGAPGRPALPVKSRLDDLVAALSRIHAAAGVRAELDVADDLYVACDPQDFDEMTGNLLDNAWKFAERTVRVTGRREGARVVLDIDDDGPGLTDEAAAAALVPGSRLDERGAGHGFGLPIALELAELHDGALTLGRAPIGGLRVTLALPARSADA
ncbi:histidine kinase [Caulobacter flavus]|uniref:histidine kinase n=1 Tax=Caulobacter flavus TaxID=1679497 RepID=A0A2N5CWN2_9CAUL|nr:HAMP domain-containing sensor histidine kinase [Caulobacter flavus]AYV47385.1 histidine kinase [Caulobacter flavus]PLR18228.1 histidine kinase [Caulobacter flavus]